MPTLQLEHAIKDFEMWKAAFDRDPIDRHGMGVRRHRVFRPVDDPQYVVVDTTVEAEACRDALGRLWSSSEAAPALIGSARVRIVERVEDQAY
jgi:hypothetical protein